MLAVVLSTAVQGIDGYLVRVEVDASQGLPHFEIVGLPDPSVREARDRVRSAIKNSGFNFPPRRITVNLAPADIKKEGPSFDLPIALGILAATEQVAWARSANLALVGELSLDGQVRSIPGVLPMAMELKTNSPETEFFCPSENVGEGALVDGLTVRGVHSLTDLVRFLNGETDLPPAAIDTDRLLATGNRNWPDMSEVKGQSTAKRALEVAAAGGHNVIMVGSPGSGKTMLARRIPSILPPTLLEECLEVTKIYSIAGLLPRHTPLITVRPFRAPHHTASAASIIGGGRMPRPGEVTLASQGILFMDEFPEFGRDVLESLRQPLEDRMVTVSRVAGVTTYPANFMLVAAMNPCPCGYLGDTAKPCACTPLQIQRYHSRISGPLLDRIDIHIQVPRLPYEQIEDRIQVEDSAAIRRRVEMARQTQVRRLHGEGITCNSQMQGKHVRRFCQLENLAVSFLRRAFTHLGLSMRAHDRLLKVARTIADLEGAERIAVSHLAEALQYRNTGHQVNPD